ncbi:MAG TPA: Mov34/MPN/PAD-1 family protein [Chitinophagaceae bacterium]|nr:Mov34/MPN/PAD-1 family protein [Chitinophagaceae bacterium]
MKPYTAPLPAVIQQAVEAVRLYYNLTGLSPLSYAEGIIVVPVTIPVSIPAKGTIGDIDIRSAEPVLLQFSLTQYPVHAPLVLSDRVDFPKNQLSHLYATDRGKPAKLCLVRGDLNEWFAGRRIEDLLGVIELWFYKAALDRLNDDGDEYDPIRLEHYKGHHIYRYALMREIADDAVPFIAGKPVSALFTTRYITGEQAIERFDFKTISSIQPIQIAEYRKILSNLNNTPSASKQVEALVSLFVWHPDQVVEGGYSTELPANYQELKAFFRQREVDIDTIINGFKSARFLMAGYIPIIYAVKRPKKIVGFDGNYEFINFLIDPEIIKNERIADRSRVYFQAHIEPFSKATAQTMSGENRDGSTLYIGAGSLGSKMIFHDGRSGKMNIGVCDDGYFRQHNLGRHSLFDYFTGFHKATAVVLELRRMYETEPLRSFEPYPVKAHLLPKEVFRKYDWLVDTTASLGVRNTLVQTDIPKTMNLAKCELVNDGRLGLLYIEGKGRNPRLDDLKNLAFFMATKDAALQAWRKADAEKDITTLDIGLGCSSSTVVMPDDIISAHAAIISTLLHHQQGRKDIGDKGLLFRSMVTMEGIPQTATRFDLVEAFDVIACQRGSGWEVRFMAGLTKRLIALCRSYKPRETGGVLIGLCNYKTKTIHVFDFTTQTVDSKGTATYFIRGIHGLPAAVNKVRSETGDMVGYIGEWHSHPMDLEALSGKDKKTIEELLPLNQKVPIPTCSVIATNHKILPFITE